MTIHAVRYHDFSMGHKVTGHEGKCRNLHGHNYRIHFYCASSGLDDLGRVIDFGVIKQLCVEWIEEHFDHNFMVWEKDAQAAILKELDPTVLVMPFNPTAENIAQYILEIICPFTLQDTGVHCTKIILEETRKCSVEVTIE